MTELRVLSLGGTKIADVGLQTLQRLSNLQELYLAGTSIGDDGLKYLAELQSMKLLSLATLRLQIPVCSNFLSDSLNWWMRCWRNVPIARSDGIVR